MNLRHESIQAERDAIEALIWYHREKIRQSQKAIRKYLKALKAIDDGNYKYEDYFGTPNRGRDNKGN